MAPSSLKKLGAAIAFASAGRVAAHSPGLLGGVVDAIFGEEPTPTHTHTTSYVTGTSTSVNEIGETTVVVVVGTTICPVTASEASESSVLPTATNPVPVLTTATSETAAVAETPSHSASGSAIVSTSLLQNSTVPMTTSTIFTTHSSTITACPTASSDCTVGDVTTIVVALSTTVCPVTATEVPSNSTVRPTASGNVPGFATSRTGAQGATTLTASPSRSSFISSKTASGSGSSSVRAQTTITSPSVVLTTVSASSTTSSAADESSVLEMATGSPSDYSAVYTDATETVAVPTDAAAVTPTTTNYNDALMSLASSVQASSAEQTGSGGCQGMDCIVVQSNSGVKSKMNASGFALVALAGAVFLL